MAYDWMKVEVLTPDKPEVYEIAQILDIDPEKVFTKLFRVWSWFDQHSENGNAPLTLRALLNSRANNAGFADAMEKVGWLEIRGDFIHLPNFDRHVGKSAKKRALTARRVAAHKRKVTPKVTDKVTPQALPDALPRDRDRDRSISTTTGRARDCDKGPRFDFSEWRPKADVITRIKTSNPDITDQFIESSIPEFVTYAEDHYRPDQLRAKFIASVNRQWKKGKLNYEKPATARNARESVADTQRRKSDRRRAEIAAQLG